MTDFQKERRRLNLELAALTGEAYEAWQGRYDIPSTATPEERKQLSSRQSQIERTIESKIKERDLVVRAMQWHARASWDEQAEDIGLSDADTEEIGATIEEEPTAEEIDAIPEVDPLPEEDDPIPTRPSSRKAK